MKMTNEEREFMRKLGKRGGEAVSKKYGKAHYQKLAEHMNKVIAEKKRQGADNSQK